MKIILEKISNMCAAEFSVFLPTAIYSHERLAIDLSPRAHH